MVLAIPKHQLAECAHFNVLELFDFRSCFRDRFLLFLDVLVVATDAILERFDVYSSGRS